MQVILIATAEIDKLRPITDKVPAPLLPIANQPVMEIIIEQLARCGLKQILVCLNHQAGAIETHFRNGQRWGVSLDYVIVPEDWGVTGALRWAKPLIKETFLVVPADAIVDLDIAAAIDLHQTHHNLATVIVHETGTGDIRKIRLNEAGQIEEIVADDPCSKLYYETGVYIFEPQVLDLIPPRKKIEIATQLLPELFESGLPVGSYIMDGYWNPLDTFTQFQEAQKTFLYNAWEGDPLKFAKINLRPTRVAGQRCNPGVWIGRNTHLHPDVRVIPPVLLGENIRVGRGAVLGPEVVIGENAIVAEEATLHGSTVFDHTYVGELVHLEDRVVDKNLVVDIHTSASLQVSDPFLLGETTNSIGEQGFLRTIDALFAVALSLLALPITLLVGLISLFTTGGIFKSVTCVKTGIDLPIMDDVADHPVFQLLRFKTRNNNGQLGWLGKWIERLEWNRLPELWNVVTGDIRLVGVKPRECEEAHLLDEAWQQGHQGYFSGFTGLWYVEGCHCDESDETLIADIYYSATRTMKGDFRILINTPRAWFTRIKETDCIHLEMKEVNPDGILNSNSWQGKSPGTLR